MVTQLWAILPRRRRRRLVLVFVAAMLAAAGEAGVVALIDPVIRALAGDDGGRNAVSTDVTRALVVFGFALVAKNAVVVVLSWFKNRELFAIQAEVSERLLAVYIRGTNPAIQQLDAGQRTSFAITEPLQLVLNGYQPVVTVVAEGLALAAVTSVLVIQRPVQTSLLIAVIALGLGLFSVATRARIVGYGRRRKESDTQRAELVRSVIESRVEVSGLGVADEVLARYRGPNRESADMTARKAFLTESAKNVLEILLVVAVGPLALVLLYTDGSELLAMLATFGMAAYRAMPALNRIMVSTQSTKFGVATADTIHGILSVEPVAGRSGVPVPARPSRRAGGDGASLEPVLELRFDGFHLRNGKSILDDRAVTLASGDVCVVWGASGSGKSTVLEALVDGADGLEIRYRGTQLERGLSQLQGRVGVTAQSPLVLPATLRENLTLGRGPDSFDVDVARPMLDRDAPSILNAASIADTLDVAIHRHAVSGGQAQRISLLRALDPSHEVVLLDEPSSALDREASSALRDRIADDRDGRVFVIVTHDPELRSMADTVVEV